MKLYYTPGACSLGPHIAAAEAGLELELAAVDLRAQPRMAEGREFLEVNPKGSVPVLKLDDGSTLTECSVILQYLAARAPDARLAPTPSDPGYWKFMEMLNFVATEVHKSYGLLFDPTTPPAARDGAVARLGKRFDVLDKALAGGAYVTGDAFTIVDCYVFTVVNWTNMLKIDLTPWPNLTAFMARTGARTGVQKALREEGLIP